VTGLSGTGLTLRNNAGTALDVNANGNFTFAGTVATGSTYNVTVDTQPATPAQTCAVANASGSANADVTNVTVTCTTSTFLIGVTVSGLVGAGLVLENNGGDPLTIDANGTATFATSIASGAGYDVTVRTQPTPPAQTCAVSGGSGTVGNAAVTGIAVDCRAEVGRFVYVAAAGPNGVDAFTIDASTGLLTPIAGSPFATTGAAPRVLFADRAGNFLYVYGDDDPTAPGATTLTGFTVDPQTGTLQAIPGLLVNFPATAHPVALHPNGAFVYVAVSDATVSANNQLHGFAIDAVTGALTPVPSSPYAIPGNETLRSPVFGPSGAFLYSPSNVPAGGTPPQGRITVYAVNATTGLLTPHAGPPEFLTNNSANELVMHPAGTHLYSRNAMSVAFTQRFTIDALDGSLTDPLAISTTPGFGVLIAPGARVYFPQLGGGFGAPAPGSIAGYVDVPTGLIGQFPDSPYATGGDNSLAAALDPSGRFIALTNIASHTISVMRIDPVQGSLTHVPGSPYTPSVGTAPGSVTFDPSAQFAYLTDSQTRSISSYTIDGDTGEPTFVNSQSMVGSPGVTPVTVLGRQ
jgi:6-phosphogluconolactonase (cycloisomerase 2 family)